jgi:putative phage-type endonuclease
MGRTAIPRPLDRIEWLELRRHYVGASEAAALIGEHPYLSIAELAAQKLTGQAKPETPAMRRGQYLEHAIATWYADEFRCSLVEPELLYIFNNCLIATLDRVLMPAGTAEPDTAVEIKSTRRYISEPDRYWYLQCQVQLLCSGFKHVVLVVLDDSDELKTFTIEPEPEIQGLLAEAASTFVADIRTGRLPERLGTLPYRAAAALHPTVERQAVELDNDTAGWCRALVCLQSRIRDLESEADVLKGMVARKLGDAAEGHFDGRTLVTWRSVTRTTIDAKRLRVSLPDVAKEFSSTSTYRQLRMVNP